jgi:NTP pyrophosphatase (non-canonical NTP hydrolase)
MLRILNIGDVMIIGRGKLMNFKEYQEFVNDMAFYPDAGKNIVYPILGLSGEAGELANRYKKVLRDDKGVITAKASEDILKELGDCLWYISATAREMGTDIENIAKLNVEKLTKRREESKKTGEWK